MPVDLVAVAVELLVQCSKFPFEFFHTLPVATKQQADGQAAGDPGSETGKADSPYPTQIITNTTPPRWWTSIAGIAPCSPVRLARGDFSRGCHGLYFLLSMLQGSFFRIPEEQRH